MTYIPNRFEVRYEKIRTSDFNFQNYQPDGLARASQAILVDQNAIFGDDWGKFEAWSAHGLWRCEKTSFCAGDTGKTTYFNLIFTGYKITEWEVPFLRIIFIKAWQLQGSRKSPTRTLRWLHAKPFVARGDASHKSSESDEDFFDPRLINRACRLPGGLR